MRVIDGTGFGIDPNLKSTADGINPALPIIR